MYRDKSTVTRLVTQIETIGLVQRVAGKQDTREKRLFLTEKGKKLMAGVTRLVQEILQLSVKGIYEDDLEVCGNPCSGACGKVGIGFNESTDRGFCSSSACF